MSKNFAYDVVAHFPVHDVVAHHYEIQGFVVEGMQYLSLFDENLLSSPKGEARRDAGKGHLAATASEKTECDLNSLVRTCMLGGVVG